MEFLGVIAYAIPRLGGNAFWCFTLMIEGAPKKNRHTVDCHSELVLVVSPGWRWPAPIEWSDFSLSA